MKAELKDLSGVENIFNILIHKDIYIIKASYFIFLKLDRDRF